MRAATGQAHVHHDAACDHLRTNGGAESPDVESNSGSSESVQTEILDLDLDPSELFDWADSRQANVFY